MARQKSTEGGVNKSQAIREILKANPKIKVKQVVNDLAARGIVVQTSLVYAIKTKMKHRRRKQVRESVTAVTGNTDPVALIMKIKHLASDVGGMKKLKSLVELLAQ